MYEGVPDAEEMEGSGVNLMELSFPNGASEQERRAFENLPCFGRISDEILKEEQ